jgi:hypothetical protein
MDQVRRLARGIADAFDAAIEAFNRFRESGGFSGVRGEALRQGLTQQRAAGGRVTGGMPYLVGEMGPELFLPGRGGNIVPNDMLGRGGGGASIVINVNAGMGANGTQVGEQIVNAIRKYERTSGPVFARA